jgi:hypothetical protein
VVEPAVRTPWRHYPKPDRGASWGEVAAGLTAGSGLLLLAGLAVFGRETFDDFKASRRERRRSQGVARLALTGSRTTAMALTAAVRSVRGTKPRSD